MNTAALEPYLTIIEIEVLLMTFLLAGLLSTRRRFSRYLASAFMLVLFRGTISVIAFFYHLTDVLTFLNTLDKSALMYGICVVLFLCEVFLNTHSTWRQVIPSLKQYWREKRHKTKPTDPGEPS